MRLLDGGDLSRLLDMGDCIREVENAFRARGKGRPAPSAVVGLEVSGGSLHAKLGALDLGRPYAVAKINANYPNNPSMHGFPVIQGLVVLFDASSGKPLACMDSAIITAMRTAAASAVAARYLAVSQASSASFIGCGTQARAHVQALRQVRPVNRFVLFDQDLAVAEEFATLLRGDEVTVTIADYVREAALSSEIVITSTPSRTPLLDVGDVTPGTFISAVGADNEHKQEIAPSLLRAAVVIVDDLEQCSRIGDLHHALDEGIMLLDDVRASLDQIVAGTADGRRAYDEIVVFDSTGVAIEDVAVAALAYERAEATGTGVVVDRMSAVYQRPIQ
jgi:ornithine cyclodeaminase/alanine dehydrogenase-like protein (mu-crystallin family)